MTTPSFTADAFTSSMSSTLGAFTGLSAAQLTQHWSQSSRLLRLHLSAGSGYAPNTLMAQSLLGVEGISGSTDLQHNSITGYQLQIDALSLDAHLELKKLLGQPILLELQTDQTRQELRAFHGHITQIACLGSNGGMAKYRLTVEPWLRFLGLGRDSAVFQDQSVLDIVQHILADYQAPLKGRSTLEPAWRLDIADPSIYALRSLTTQYQESDLAFINRLLAEEGLFYWFEHTGEPQADNLGQHTLVIADHNGAFKPLERAGTGLGTGSTIRFSQSSAVIEDDTIDHWHTQARWHTHSLEHSSWDYRTLQNRPASHDIGPATQQPSGVPALIQHDTPGTYAYEDTAQGQRLAQQHLEAISVAAHTISAQGSVRTLRPGHTFTLSEHASQDPSKAHIVLRVIHQARNNLSAELHAASQSLQDNSAQQGPSPLEMGVSSYINHSKTATANTHNPTGNDTLYRNSTLALPLERPYRAMSADGHGARIHPKPNAPGSQTALVIGVPGQALSTERDHRVKVQFAWQRGARSHSRLDHPAPDGHSGAPAADETGATTGTWVRVATPLAPIAGHNWGSVALPRIGQEVLVTFQNGDIDRPLIVGTLYNGQGQDTTQHNKIAAGAANATGNAPAWYPTQTQGAVLTGIKTQSLPSSQHGGAAGEASYNQLVFDDSPEQSRTALHNHNVASAAGANNTGPHSGSSELNLGHLRQQSDNQRLDPSGFGFELKTHHSGAVRAGSGLLLSADARQGNASGAASAQLDNKEAIAQLQTAQSLHTALSTTAQAHQSRLPVQQGNEPKPEELPHAKQLAQHLESQQTKASGQAAENTAGSEGAGQGGGQGEATAWGQPDIVISAPGGVAGLTPKDMHWSAGTSSQIAAGHDINLLAQGHASHSVKGGISLFTYGKASNSNKPNQEVGIKLHAASGKVSSQSQSGPTRLTADQDITVASTHNAVTVQTPEQILLTAGGAYIKMSGGDIELVAPGMITIKAGAKSWEGPGSASNSLSLPKPKAIPPCAQMQAKAAADGAAVL